MTNVSEYTKQAEEFLSNHAITFKAVRIGSDCPAFCEDHAADRDMDKINTFPRHTHIHGAHYLCTLSRAGKDVHFDFWNSYADEEKNAVLSYNTGDWRLRDKYKGQKRAKVEAYDLLACITKYDPGDFEDFCSEFGYNTDSRKAEETYRAVVAEFRKVEKFFTVEELAELQEIN